ncbi:ABC transporter ATP-binding protein [Spirochaetota bacterium]
MTNKNTELKTENSGFLYYIKPYWHLFMAGLLAILIVTAARLSSTLILRELVDKAIPRSNMNQMLKLAFLYFFLIIIMGALSYFQSIISVKLGLKIVTRIKDELFSHLLTLPVSYFDKNPVGVLMARVENDTEKVKSLFSETGIMLLSNIIYFFGMLLVLFFLNPKAAAIMFLPMPLFLFMFFFVFDKLKPLYEKVRKQYAKITATTTEFIQGIEVLQVFNRCAYAMERLEKDSLSMRNAEMKSQIVEYSTMGFMGFLGGPILIVLVINISAPQIFKGTLTLGTLLVFIEYGMRLLEPLMNIGENIRSIQQARVALKRIFSIFELEAENSGCGIEAFFNDRIEFRDVNFSYKDNEPVLNNVSFTVEKGSTVALVGASGSGKTTTISLLCRFYELTGGEILVDGTNLDNFELYSWRKKIGLVLQDIYLFPGSILENVRVYNDEVAEADVSKALALVHADKFVKSLPSGHDTELHERGSNLSMGEKQLLSFARALAFDPSIIVMDEATASVDPTTERHIQESMKELLKGRTAIIVAHRLSSILNADKILFFKDGRILAQGRHEELLASLPDYAELVKLQFPDLSGNGKAKRAQNANKAAESKMA